MCGIFALTRKPGSRATPDRQLVLAHAVEGRRSAEEAVSDPSRLTDHLGRAAERLRQVSELLDGQPGLLCLLRHHAFMAELDAVVGAVEGAVAQVERRADDASLAVSSDLEQMNASLVACKDATWAIRQDRLGHARAVSDLAGAGASDSAAEAFSSVQYALSALDRLEVRGRDSAGIHLLISAHGLDRTDERIAAELQRRSDPLFRSLTASGTDAYLSLVYKVAHEVGELGANTSALRAAIVEDWLLRRALESDGVRISLIAHTRWASVGLINEANAHPVHNGTLSSETAPYAVAALNGDVDNYRDLVARYGLRVPAGITTDAKVIPALLTRELERGADPSNAFRQAVDQMYGSVAIAAASTRAPSDLMLAIRGSGQALCVGAASDMFVVASEPYGIVEITPSYLRLDGESANELDGSQGQIAILSAGDAGRPESIRRMTYGGTAIPVTAAELKSLEITTRDIHRGTHRHYLLKEINESPQSLRKTLRGRLAESKGKVVARLDPDALPDQIRERLRAGAINRVIVVGQGTAAVAASGVAASISAATATGNIAVSSQPASELSAFGLTAQMADTLVIAVSQSGTTTDTNRTVDLARSRGAWIIGIVNRRNSDLTHKAHGVLYTSDGRDVEMSVASTKAFYSQMAAGVILAYELARSIGCLDVDHEHQVLTALAELPIAMKTVLGKREEIADIAQRHAPRRRDWAIVGSGANSVAANEIRIKMSELCYKSIAVDVTEDKKHIDLSCEPLTLVCAAGLTGSAANDVAKEIAIFKAHKGVPVVIATEGSDAFEVGPDSISVPQTHRDLAHILSTIVGHLFGYEAALAIDEQAYPLRQSRAKVAFVARQGHGSDRILSVLSEAIDPHVADFRNRLWSGLYDAALGASVTARLSSLFSYVEGSKSLETYDREFGNPGLPSTVVEDLTSALTHAIDNLTRPVDTIRHQAKTVTVGISRSDEELLIVPLVRSVLSVGTAPELLTYRTLRTLAALDPAIAATPGCSRYGVVPHPDGLGPEINLLRREGIASGIRSRTESDPRLRGTKRLVAESRDVLVARGRNDGRLVLFVPEVSNGRTTGLVLLHVELRQRLDSRHMKRVLEGYQGRFALLAEAVMETESAFDEARLGALGVEQLLTWPIGPLADLWSSHASFGVQTPEPADFTER
jgi:glucosamine--fructose-6-phosphate aminotransferase (isomerizing)